MESKPRRDDNLPLAHRITQESPAAETAAAALALWQSIAASLTPILGPQGFAALCKRSLHLAAVHHAWLSALPADPLALMDGEAVRSAIAQQGDEEAARGAQAFFLAFHDLLATLIGSSLTERLLRMAWPQASRGPPPPEILP